MADVEPPGELGTTAGLKTKENPPAGRAPAVIVTIVIATIVGLSLWYLSRPEPLLVQGEADSTRVDIAARVDGRVTGLPAVRGQDVQSGAVLVEIDNPELLARRDEAVAAKAVAEAELARINAGTRSETVAVRKAEIDRAQAELTLAQQTYDRVRPLVATHVEPQSKLDDATDALQVGQRGLDQAKLAYDEAVAGFTREEHEMAEAKVARAEAAVGTLQALVDQLAVTAPLAAQVFERNVELGEVVAPGVPLLTLVDLADVWLRFDLREDLVRGLKVGDRIAARIPALGDRSVEAEVRLIASKGEYAGWRATRATGDFDLRTFEVRAYPIDKIAGLRPGMSAYVDWRAGGG